MAAEATPSESKPWLRLPGSGRAREFALGAVGTLALAALWTTVVGPLGAGAAVAVGLVFALVGGPYAYALGQVLVATLLQVPLDDPFFLPVQGALLLVCFGHLLATARPVETAVAAVGSLVVAGALLVVSLGSAASFWQTSVLLVAAAGVATAGFIWYDPSSRMEGPRT
jgi:hypothetical protein